MKQSIAANLFRGTEAVGGKLIFKDNRLIFESHNFNIQTGKTEIPYDIITEVKPRNTLGLVPNGMSVFVKSGEEYRFVIWNRKEVMAFIGQKANL